MFQAIEISVYHKVPVRNENRQIFPSLSSSENVYRQAKLIGQIKLVPPLSVASCRFALISRHFDDSQTKTSIFLFNCVDAFVCWISLRFICCSLCRFFVFFRYFRLRLRFYSGNPGNPRIILKLNRLPLLL